MTTIIIAINNNKNTSVVISCLVVDDVELDEPVMFTRNMIKIVVNLNEKLNENHILRVTKCL